MVETLREKYREGDLKAFFDIIEVDAREDHYLLDADDSENIYLDLGRLGRANAQFGNGMMTPQDYKQELALLGNNAKLYMDKVNEKHKKVMGDKKGNDNFRIENISGSSVEINIGTNYKNTTTVNTTRFPDVKLFDLVENVIQYNYRIIFEKGIGNIIFSARGIENKFSKIAETYRKFAQQAAISSVTDNTDYKSLLILLLNEMKGYSNVVANISYDFQSGKLDSLIIALQDSLKAVKENSYNEQVLKQAFSSTSSNQIAMRPVSSQNTLDSIFSVYKSYFLFISEHHILFPSLVKEVKAVAQEILLLLDKLIDSNDLNEIEKIKNSIPDFYKGLDEFASKARKELSEAQNSEGSQILTVLAAETPDWDSLKKAFTLLKQMGKGHLIDFPEDEPISPMSKRFLKQKFFNIVK